MKKFNEILVTIYIHPEFYISTLNAIREFSSIADKIIVVTRNLVNSDWKFPVNVSIKTSGNFVSLMESNTRTPEHNIQDETLKFQYI